jgi:hypothetical protein
LCNRLHTFFQKKFGFALLLARKRLSFMPKNGRLGFPDSIDKGLKHSNPAKEGINPGLSYPTPLLWIWLLTDYFFSRWSRIT